MLAIDEYFSLALSVSPVFGATHPFNLWHVENLKELMGFEMLPIFRSTLSRRQYSGKPVQAGPFRSTIVHSANEFVYLFRFVSYFLAMTHGPRPSPPNMNVAATAAAAWRSFVHSSAYKFHFAWAVYDKLFIIPLNARKWKKCTNEPPNARKERMR